MQVVEGSDGCSEVALGMVQLLYVPCNLFDLCKEEARKGSSIRQGQRCIKQINNHPYKGPLI